MAFATHVLCQLSGTLNQGEVFSTGVRLRMAQGGALPSGDALDGHLADMAGRVATDWADPNLGISSTAYLTTIKLNVIQPDGTYRDPVTHRHDYAAPGVAGGSAPQIPSILSFAVTLRTGFARGRAANGRMYMPNFGIPMASLDPPVSTPAVRTAVAQTMVTLLREIVGEFPPGQPASVWAVPIVASKLDGTVHDVTRVEVGSVVDYMSSRKDALRESYVGEDFSV